MSEERKKKPIDQVLKMHNAFDPKYRMPGFEPRKIELAELGKTVEIRKERDARMLTGYLLAKETIRNLQRVKEEIEERGLQDVQKEDKVNQAIKRILRGK